MLIFKQKPHEFCPWTPAPSKKCLSVFCSYTLQFTYEYLLPGGNFCLVKWWLCLIEQSIALLVIFDVNTCTYSWDGESIHLLGLDWFDLVLGWLVDCFDVNMWQIWLKWSMVWVEMTSNTMNRQSLSKYIYFLWFLQKTVI